MSTSTPSLRARAPQLIDVELRRGRADEHRDLAVTVPAERGDAAGKLLVGLAGEDRVDHQRLEPRIPQPARLRGARVDVRRGEGYVAGVQQDALAQVVALADEPLLGDLHRHADELQRLRAG